MKMHSLLLLVYIYIYSFSNIQVMFDIVTDKFLIVWPIKRKGY